MAHLGNTELQVIEKKQLSDLVFKYKSPYLYLNTSIINIHNYSHQLINYDSTDNYDIIYKYEWMAG